MPFNYKFIATFCQILWGDGLYVATIKLKKQGPTCHVADDKLLGEWSPRELRPSETKNLGDQLETVLAAKRILLQNVTVGLSVI